MILHKIRLLLTNLATFILSLLWFLFSKGITLIFFIILKVYNFITILFNIFNYLLSILLKSILLLIIKILPTIVIFVTQAILDILTLLMLGLSKLLQGGVRVQQYLINFIGHLSKCLEHQRRFMFHFLYNRFITPAAKKEHTSRLSLIKLATVKCLKGFIHDHLTAKLHRRSIQLTSGRLKVIDLGKPEVAESTESTDRQFRKIFFFPLKLGKFIQNGFLLIFFIITSFITSLIQPKTYSKIIKIAWNTLKLVIHVIIVDIQLAVLFIITLPYKVFRLIKIVPTIIKPAFYHFIYRCNKNWFKTIVVVSLLIITIINVRILIYNRHKLRSIAAKYQTNMSITNAAPTFISFVSRLKNDALIKYTKISLNVSDFNELNKQLLYFNVNPNEITQINTALNTGKLSKILPFKDTVQVILSTSKKNNCCATVTQLEIPLNMSYNLVLEKDDNKTYVVTQQKKEITKYLIKQSFVIEGSYYNSAYNLQLPSNIINILSTVLSRHIDFQREVHTGNTVDILYQCLYNKNKLISCNQLLYAAINLNHKKLVFYNYQGNYYLANGRSADTELLRTPLKGYKVSSPFGNRQHPILGYSVFHKGVDFAAPTGTPVPASGNGVVKRIVSSNSYGKYIEIQHNAYLSTVYAHLNAFAKNLTIGKKVSQGDIIGYVGATGRATGPHLHYEIHFNGNPVNPMDVKIPSSYYLTDENLTKFNLFKKAITQILMKLPLNKKTPMDINEVALK